MVTCTAAGLAVQRQGCRHVQGAISSSGGGAACCSRCVSPAPLPCARPPFQAGRAPRHQRAPCTCMPWQGMPRGGLVSFTAQASHPRTLRHFVQLFALHCCPGLLCLTREPAARSSEHVCFLLGRQQPHQSPVTHLVPRAAAAAASSSTPPKAASMADFGAAVAAPAPAAPAAVDLCTVECLRLPTAAACDADAAGRFAAGGSCRAEAPPLTTEGSGGVLRFVCSCASAARELLPLGGLCCCWGICCPPGCCCPDRSCCCCCCCSGGLAAAFFCCMRRTSACSAAGTCWVEVATPAPAPPAGRKQGGSCSRQHCSCIEQACQSSES